MRVIGRLSAADPALYFGLEIQRPPGTVWNGIDRGLYYGLLAPATRTS